MTNTGTPHQPNFHNVQDVDLEKKFYRRNTKESAMYRQSLLRFRYLRTGNNDPVSSSGY
eukprot:CAMPEP_0204826998 /NCGR_PEP_ID=MMETSP1346-20131115/4575_1 /ASSEMBLY_ACC=CAM_ASM_000771 /TAXON_ID=215587 /ORGANISM="Aplanochytrium stocchinoi, Strain GSBS06" /LENGTH=58 /DNA_ID=CAMNT_0051955267 /DNA_START=417 /DNA_END=593 /DNA_ORIENTATION=+